MAKKKTATKTSSKRKWRKKEEGLVIDDRAFMDLGKESKGKIKPIVRPKNWDEVETMVQADTYFFDKKPPAAAKKYPPPRTNPTFVARWNEFIADVTERENFKIGHLSQLVILCDLFVEYDNLTMILTEQGHTFFAEGGRNGPQLKRRPEVEQLNKTRSEIRNYCKILGLLLHKDTDTGGEEDAGDWE